VHKIATWSHITNAHPVPGPSIIKGLATVGVPLGRGLLLLAEMSTAGTLARGAYTEDAVRMARDARDFVIGFIAQSRMEGVGICEGTQRDETEDFLILTPGVGLDTTGDGLGQQYRTPEQVVTESGCDIIIVGRGIYGKPGNLVVGEVQRQAERYKGAGWNAYLQRLNHERE
jgi:orotidine-5'-phosphate decarboxylase